MSWDICLKDENGYVDVPDFEEGGTYKLGGSQVADLNVTYNYSTFFDFKKLHGVVAAETLGNAVCTQQAICALTELEPRP